MFILLSPTTSCLIPSLPVQAEPKTIVVPDDYPTLSLAIQNAGAGDTVFVKRGTYHEESININKPISLIGEGINETILSLNPPLVEINYFHNWIWIPDKAIKINANDVKLQGFTINLPKDNHGGIGSGISAVGNAISFTNNIVANRSVYMRGSMLNITCNSIPGALEVVG